MTKCPFCGGKLSGSGALVPLLTARHHKIYNLIAEAGPNGLAQDVILAKLYPTGYTDGKKVALRVAVHYLNNKIGAIGQRIKSRKGVGYYLSSV